MRSRLATRSISMVTSTHFEGISRKGIPSNIGYVSSWGIPAGARGQLHREIKENAWAVANGSLHTVFEAEGDRYWKDSVGLLGKDYLLWTTYPKDPNLN